MINPSEIKQKAERLYPNFLKASLKEENFFPKEFPVGKRPTEYLALQNSVIQLIENSKEKLGYGYTLELTSCKTNRYGSQTLPTRISIETEIDYLKLINREKKFALFKKNVELIRLKIPQLELWICQNPLKIIEYSEQWIDLLKVCKYFIINPKPNLYLRELSIEVHTKFIEENKGIIRNLLEAILPLEMLQPIEFEKERIFEKRFSLKYNEPLIRLRILDDFLKNKYCFPVSDLSTPISEFKQLNLKGHRCIITENLMNFLTLPTLTDSFAIWGSGYGIQILKSVNWLAECPIFYWGDLDAHGFGILSQLRSYFPQTRSVMMDKKTFKTFEQFVVTGSEIKADNMPHLTLEEYSLFTYLSQSKKRLEQERISQDFADWYLQKIL